MNPMLYTSAILILGGHVMKLVIRGFPKDYQNTPQKLLSVRNMKKRLKKWAARALRRDNILYTIFELNSI